MGWRGEVGGEGEEGWMGGRKGELIGMRNGRVLGGGNLEGRGGTRIEDG